MIKNVFIAVLAITLSQFTFSQDIEFGEITKDELMEKTYPQDSSANAVILYKKQDTYFSNSAAGTSLITEIHQRVKIYNKEGFDYATVSIDLFNGRSDEERVGKIKAYTYNLEGNKIVKTELDKHQIFKTEVSYNYNQVKFTMPNIKEGSVFEFKYKITSPFIWNIDEFQFQYDIPVKKEEAEIRTPKGFRFNQTSKGFLSFFPTRSTKTDHRLGMVVDICKYTLNNVPAIKAESYVDNIDNYKAGVMFELLSIEIPGVFYREYSKSWSDVAKTIGSSSDYKNELDKTNSFDETLDTLVQGKADKVEKMKAIFKYVKDNLKWNGMDGKYFYKGIRKTLKEKKGNAADLNLILVAMLRYAGIDANPLVISTKDNFIPIFPTVDRLNYVLAYAVIDQKRYFLDATDEFSDINVLPVKDYNWQGILIDNHKKVWKKIDIMQPETAVGQYIVNASLNEDGEINGTFTSRYNRHNALKFRENYKDQDLDGFMAAREKRFDNIEISNYNVKNTNDYEGFVSESFEFYKENASDLINSKIYIAPFLFLKVDENPFKLDERKFPIDFGFPFSNNYSITLAIPDGYAIESMPEPIYVKIPDELGEFKYFTKALGNKIQLRVSYKINRAMIKSQSYLILKEFFNQMITKENEQVVLTKI